MLQKRSADDKGKWKHDLADPVDDDDKKNKPGGDVDEAVRCADDSGRSIHHAVCL